MEQIELKESQLVDNCDAIVFSSYVKDDQMHTVMTFFKTDNDVAPTDLGHKFNVLMFREYAPKGEALEQFSAILGDPKGYVERIGEMGYHGIVAKVGACDREDLKKMFSSILSIWGFRGSQLKKVLQSVT